MMEIQIPFLDEFKSVLLGGKKTLTCRTKVYGKRGDYFKIDDAMFVITGVDKIDLGYIAERSYLAEGCNSTEAFINVWNKIHRRKKYDPATMVYAHEFFKLNL